MTLIFQLELEENFEFQANRGTHQFLRNMEDDFIILFQIEDDVNFL